jgi:hypothetical protein
MGSKNNFLPKATPSMVNGLSAGIIGGINLSEKRVGIFKRYGVGT